MDALLFLSLTTFPSHILSNRPYSPPSLVFAVVRKLEHWSHFSLIFSLWMLPPFLPLTTFPLYVLPNRLHSPPSLVFIVASSLT